MIREPETEYYIHRDEMLEKYRAITSNTSNLLASLLDASYDGLLIFDDSGKAVWTLGLLAQRIEKEKFFVLKRMCQEVVLTKKRVTSLLEKPGSDQALLVTASPVFGRNSEVNYVVCNLRDLKDLISLQSEIYHMNFREKDPLFLAELETYKNETKDFVTRSVVMQRMLSCTLKVAQVDSTVLLLGESGVGKDVLARLIHKVGRRKDRPFVKISCGAIPENLLESELFGYEGGAFTGARKEGKSGLFELAADGTVFLDEVGELPLSLQVKLLNVLQDRVFYRVGGLRPISTNARVIAATNRDLEKQVEEGTFRADLFYRLNVIPISIPPLRERRGDILPLVQHFLRVFNERHGFRRILSQAVLDLLVKYDWPGNVRELQNVMEYLVVMAQDNVIEVENLPPQITASVQGKKTSKAAHEKLSLKEAIEEYECELIIRALSECGTLREAAETLGIDLSTLTRKKQKYGLLKA